MGRCILHFCSHENGFALEKNYFYSGGRGGVVYKLGKFVNVPVCLSQSNLNAIRKHVLGNLTHISILKKIQHFLR